jgi:D-lactate dehydrogenase (cytochrome)
MNDPALLDQLRQFLGDRLSTAPEVLAEHSHDVSRHRPRPPHAVAFPESTEEVSRIVSLCAESRTPIIPFGTGTAVEGGVVAIHGGVSIDLRRMNRILRVNVADRDAAVEAGVTRKQLNRHLEETGSGLFFPVDPGADASLGGMASTNASGSSALRYGMMRDNVMGLTVVLADGRVIRTGGRARKSSAGYDLTRVFAGAEGTLGIITELTLRLTLVPEAASAAVCRFGSIEAAVNAVMAIMAAGVPMARIELLDEVQMAAVARYSKLSYAAAPTLFFEFHGSESAVVEQARKVGEIATGLGGGEFQWALEKSERDRLWQARYDAYYASLALRPGSIAYGTDVCVPVSRLAECIVKTKEILKETRLPCPLFGHVGDGNFHVILLLDPESDAELAEAQALNDRIVELALSLEGTCTGEHGVGMGKLDALIQERGEAVNVMRAIKQTLDPHNLMNPGKVLRLGQVRPTSSVPPTAIRF